MRYSLLSALAFAWPLAAAAQTPAVTMPEALAGFARSALELRIARAEGARAVGQAQRVGALANPVFGVTRESLSDATRSAGETYVTLSQNLPWPWAFGARRGAVGHTRAAAAARYAADSLQLAWEVRVAWIDAWLAARRHQVAVTVAEAVQAAGRDAEARLAEGDIAGYDARRLRLERARYARAAAQREADLLAARRRLADLVDPEGPAELATAGEPGPAPATLDRARILDLARTGRPETRAADAEAAAATAAARAVGGTRYGSPSVTVGYKTQQDGLTGLFLGVALPLPFLSRGTGAVTEARADVSLADARSLLTARQVVTDVRNALDRFAAAVVATDAAATLDGVATGW